MLFDFGSIAEPHQQMFFIDDLDVADELSDPDIGTAIGTYYCQYVLGNGSLLGLISMSAFIMIIGLIANPGLVKKFGMYKVNLISYIITIPVAALLMFFGYRASFIGVLVLTFIRGITTAPLQGSINAIIAEVGQNAYSVFKVHFLKLTF